LPEPISGAVAERYEAFMRGTLNAAGGFSRSVLWVIAESGVDPGHD
jgi:hypothetical protein